MALGGVGYGHGASSQVAGDEVQLPVSVTTIMRIQVLRVNDIF
jgi:hypothetical protein